jgi:hypothetical protein
VEIHFGAALLDVETGNPLGAFGSLDYFWYPYICLPPTPTPVVMQALQFIHGCNDQGNVEWTVSNPNPFDVTLNWSVIDGDKSGAEVVLALAAVQVFATSASPQTLHFSWIGPEGQTGSTTETNGDDHCSVEEPTPTPTDDPGDPTPTVTPTPAPTDKPEDPKPQPSPTPVPEKPQDPRSSGDVDLPPYAASAAQPPVQLAPLDPPVAVASAQDTQILIPVTGADFSMPAAGIVHTLLIHLGLVLIGMALMTHAITRKFVEV